MAALRAFVLATITTVTLALVAPISALGQEFPVGVDDEYGAPHAGDIAVDAARGVLANDSGNALAAELWVDATSGSVTLAPDGSFSYVPTELSSVDRFSYVVTDADGVSTDPVEVTLRFANHSPSCAAPLVPDSPDGAVIEFDLVEACTDADGDALVFSYQDPDIPIGSTWEADEGGHIRFVPPPGWTGTGTVIFCATDGRGTSMSVVFAVDVLPGAGPT
jgi:large repetitive protein